MNHMNTVIIGNADANGDPSRAAPNIISLGQFAKSSQSRPSQAGPTQPPLERQACMLSPPQVPCSNRQLAVRDAH
jgi:hypothetical protein